jgi:hypothetical protein
LTRGPLDRTVLRVVLQLLRARIHPDKDLEAAVEVPKNVRLLVSNKFNLPTDQKSEANIDQPVEKCDGYPELRQTAGDHRVRDQLHVHASSTMGADKARKPVTAMSDLHAIENVGTPFEQRRPRRAYQLVFAYGWGAAAPPSETSLQD